MRSDRDGSGKFVKGHRVSADVRCKIGKPQRGKSKPSVSIGLKKYFSDPANRKKVSDAQKKLHTENPGMFDSFVTVKRMREEGTLIMKSSSEAMKKRWCEPGYRENISSKMKSAWKDSKYPWNNTQFREEVEAKVLKANQVRPNKAEKRLLCILDEKFPSHWRYVGDGSFWIEGKNPDFVNVNGQKQIIELLGNYWHKSVDQSRIRLFKKHGFRTLIIWASELKHPQQVVAKIKKFEEV